MDSVVSLDGVSKVVGGQEILKGIHLDIVDGEMFGFIGPNGAGKTTLMKIIAGLTEPSNTINTYEKQKGELETNISKTNSQIDSAVVKATKAGYINSNIELVKGNYLQAGAEVLSIIPENDNEYKFNIYVSNEDIGKIKDDMEFLHK